MPHRLPPEILRTDLANFILKLKGLGVGDLLTFEFIETPPETSIIKAI